jgi:hypothetical protein
MRVAYDALDKLSSVRANFDRLQAGVGLPTRAMPAPRFIRTALSVTPSTAVAPGITYHNLAALGATDDPHFHWLFRDSLTDYHKLATVFRKWVFRMLRDMVHEQETRLSAWADTFALYDKFVYGNSVEKSGEQVGANPPGNGGPVPMSPDGSGLPGFDRFSLAMDALFDLSSAATDLPL